MCIHYIALNINDEKLKKKVPLQLYYVVPVQKSVL